MNALIPLAFAALAWRRAAQTARLMVGVPDYDAYVAHLRDRHPERVPMSRPQFFRAVQDARFDGRPGRCC